MGGGMRSAHAQSNDQLILTRSISEPLTLSVPAFKSHSSSIVHQPLIFIVRKPQAMSSKWSPGPLVNSMKYKQPQDVHHYWQ